MNVAPYEVVVTVLRPEDADTLAAANRIYEGLRADGVDVILDDRKERPGVKFADAELVGFPLRVTVGPRGVESGLLELVTRATGTVEEVPVDEVVAVVLGRVTAAKH
jgi:prolyl-tRNA synthetase